MLGGAKERRIERSQSQVNGQSEVKVKQGSLANVVWSWSSRVHGHIIYSYLGYVSLYQVMSVTFREKNNKKSVPTIHERESSNVDVEIVL